MSVTAFLSYYVSPSSESLSLRAVLRTLVTAA